MRNNWLFFMDLEGGSPYFYPIEFISNGFGGHLLSHVTSFVDRSIYGSRHLYALEKSAALQETFNCFSKFAGAFLMWLSSGSNFNIRHRPVGDLDISKPNNWKSCTKVDQSCSSKHNPTGFRFSSRSKGNASGNLPFDEVPNFTIGRFCGEVKGLESIPVFILATALVPPLDNMAPKVASALEDAGVRSCEVDHQISAHFSFPDLHWTRDAVEPRTGIEFPPILDNFVDGENNSSFTSEVLVGTGSRTMKIIKIKTMKVYAFGFYVHPFLVCEKLGPKYASVPVDELNKCQDFYEDLLRADINMTVRLVVNCNGMKINTVRDAFEKSLRARLLKTNPDTDYECLTTFGSYFTQDIPLPAGTTIDFRQTADGQLVTAIEGRTIGVVHSKDLCRAFFDMYIGEVPVSHQTKEEIGRNVAHIIRKC